MPLQLKPRIKIIAASSILLSIIYGCSNSPQRQAVSATDTTIAKSTTVNKPALNPDIEAAFNQGLDAINNKEYDKAIDIFYAISRAQPNLSGAYANLGMLLVDKKDYADAETALQHARRLNPDNPEIYNQLGLLYRHQGRFNEALLIYEQGLVQSPENSHLLRNTGILLDLYLNTPGIALEYYQRYLKLQPDDQQVQLWIADLNQRIMP